jgi:hypothetical protein
MKLKRIALVTVVCAIIFSVIGSASVFAPPQTPLLPAPIEVINPPDESLNVVVTNDTLAVTLDESIEIVNPDGESLNVTLDEPIDVVVANDTLAVTLDEPIDVVVTNTYSPLDVSGWLHTTQSGHESWNTFNEGSDFANVFVQTEGYREITIVFDSSQDNVVFGISWLINDTIRDADAWTFGSQPSPTFTTPEGTTPSYFFKTYPVQGETLRIAWYAAAGVLWSGDFVDIAYYMTT